MEKVNSLQCRNPRRISHFFPIALASLVATIVLGIGLGAYYPELEHEIFLTILFTFLGSLISAISLTERNIAGRERIARLSADSANAAKSQFLAQMSHEIRTPVGIVIGYAEMLAAERISDDLRMRYASTILRNSRNLLAILNDILDVSKVESGQLSIEKGTVLIMPYVAELVAPERLLAGGRGVKFQCTFSSAVPEAIVTDQLRLRQILLNLLSNARKFTTNGSVSLEIDFVRDCGKDNSALRFKVTDSGCGISNSQQKKLFTAFCQADCSISRKYGGTGLGLFLSKKLANALGGKIELVASELGRGSIFMFTLPVGDPRLFTMVDPVTANGFTMPTPRAEYEFHASSDLPLLGLRILVVDDFEDNVGLVSTFVTSAGAEVRTASHGGEALAVIESHPVDIVLMDLQMPVMNGYEAVARIRERKLTIPIIALTAHAMDAERSRCLESGFDGYLSKPFQHTQLISAIRVINDRIIRRKASEDDPGFGRLLDLIQNKSLTPVIRKYVDRLPGRADSMRAMLANNEWQALKTLAHQLRGSGGSYGLPEISRIAGRIEDEMNDPQGADVVDSLITEFETASIRVKGISASIISEAEANA